jgi:hypothetical protein
MQMSYTWALFQSYFIQEGETISCIWCQGMIPRHHSHMYTIHKVIMLVVFTVFRFCMVDIMNICNETDTSSLGDYQHTHSHMVACWKPRHAKTAGFIQLNIRSFYCLNTLHTHVLRKEVISRDFTLWMVLMASQVTRNTDWCPKCKAPWMPDIHHIQTDTVYAVKTCVAFTLPSSINQVFYSQFTDTH